LVFVNFSQCKRFATCWERPVARLVSRTTAPQGLTTELPLLRSVLSDV